MTLQRDKAKISAKNCPLGADKSPRVNTGSRRRVSKGLKRHHQPSRPYNKESNIQGVPNMPAFWKSLCVRLHGRHGRYSLHAALVWVGKMSPPRISNKPHSTAMLPESESAAFLQPRSPSPTHNRLCSAASPPSGSAVCLSALFFVVPARETESTEYLRIVLITPLTGEKKESYHNYEGATQWALVDWHTHPVRNCARLTEMKLGPVCCV